MESSIVGMVILVDMVYFLCMLIGVGICMSDLKANIPINEDQYDRVKASKLIGMTSIIIVVFIFILPFVLHVLGCLSMQLYTGVIVGVTVATPIILYSLIYFLAKKKR